jgi:clan AA aspartic protease
MKCLGELLIHQLQNKFEMGLVYSTITLKNPIHPDLSSLDVKCLVDSGATYLCIPSHIAHQLSLNTLQEKEVTLANGESFLVPYVGPVQVHFENRVCFVGAVVIGDECLLGAIPMEDMRVPNHNYSLKITSGDLIIHPKLFTLAVNPANPNIARGVAKGLPRKANDI